MEIDDSQVGIISLALDTFIRELIARLDNTDWRGEERTRANRIFLLKTALNLREKFPNGDDIE